jgi:hypothetical protein
VCGREENEGGRRKRQVTYGETYSQRCRNAGDQERENRRKAKREKQQRTKKSTSR